MDLQMPQMNGFEATAAIRKQLKSKVPIIALTADVTTVDLEKCKKVGMNDYISKPIDDKVLFKKIATYLNLKENTMEKEIAKQRVEEGRITNLDFLRQLTKNNPDMINEMIRVYLEETPELLGKMKEALYRKDWQVLRAAAHSIFPSFATVGIDKVIGNKAKEIQIMAEKKENHEKVKELLNSLETAFLTAAEELRGDLTFSGANSSANKNRT
jgi:CheY-like chemotaxis protein